MERLEEIIDGEPDLEVFDIRNVPQLMSSDETLDRDRFMNMTSLGAMMFLSQHDSKTSFGLKPKKEEEQPVDKSRLSLAYERLHKFPKLLMQEMSSHIQILDISHNEFDNLDFLVHFTRLTSLICDHNNITTATNIPYLPKLELLWLNHCHIDDLYPWAKNLQLACPGLQYLSLMGNQAAPSYLNGGNFYEYLQYRLFIISLFPNLIHLDDRSVTEDQRKEAIRLYKKQLIQIIEIKKTMVPSCIRKVSGKVNDFFSTTPSLFGKQQKNIII